jgi:xanthine dehydrogenase YagT iron-sulfur-binding subunit
MLKIDNLRQTPTLTKPYRPVTRTVNGRSHSLLLEPRRVLLDVLRHDLALTGTKKVCTMGDCGACTVHLDGEAVYSCLVLGVECEGRHIQTIEGLAQADSLDPVQSAFIEADAYQCGFCTAGQIMSLKALLNQTDTPAEAEIIRAVSGNLCRCGAYQNILAAGKLAADKVKEANRGH